MVEAAGIFNFVSSKPPQKDSSPRSPLGRSALLGDSTLGESAVLGDTTLGQSAVLGDALADTTFGESGVIGVDRTKLGATESTRVPEDGNASQTLGQFTSSFGATDLADSALLEEASKRISFDPAPMPQAATELDPASAIGAAVDAYQADMVSTANALAESMEKLDAWKDLFDESRPPTPKPGTPRHLFSHTAPEYASQPPWAPAAGDDREVVNPAMARPVSAHSAGSSILAASDVPASETSDAPSFIGPLFEGAVLDDIGALEDLLDEGLAAHAMWDSFGGLSTPSGKGSMNWEDED